jgi:hypothetical protein
VCAGASSAVVLFSLSAVESKPAPFLSKMIEDILARSEFSFCGVKDQVDECQERF